MNKHNKWMIELVKSLTKEEREKYMSSILNSWNCEIGDSVLTEEDLQLLFFLLQHNIGDV